MIKLMMMMMMMMIKSPHRHRTRAVQPYSPGGANVHSHVIMLPWPNSVHIPNGISPLTSR